jgi:hypothetical protein
LQIFHLASGGWLCAMPVWQNVNLKQKAAGGNSPPALLHWKTPFE